MEEQWAVGDVSTGRTSAVQQSNARSGSVTRAVKVWTDQLVDLSARNNAKIVAAVEAAIRDARR
jgi:hypothetical protein